VEEDDDAGGGEEAERSIGADRCQRLYGCVENAALANRTAYCLSLPVHDKVVHADELCFDRFVVRFKLECLLKIYGGKTPQDNDDNDDDTCSNIRRKVGLIIGYTPLWASPSFWSAVRACALRKSALTFFLERPSTAVQSRSASSFLRCVCREKERDAQLME
jgi:hypothetical protein